MQKNIVILISGTGSNMQAIVNARIKNTCIAAIISNQPDAKGVLWAKQQGLNTIVLEHKKFPTRATYDRALRELIDEFNPDLVVLAGFMRILTAEFCLHYQQRLMNIHPSLLPAFPGLDTHQKSIDSGCKIAGCTVHFVTPELDCGPIIAQAAVSIKAEDTAQTLAERVLRYEHIIYPTAVEDFVLGYLSIEGNRVINQRKNDSSLQTIINF